MFKLFTTDLHCRVYPHSQSIKCHKLKKNFQINNFDSYLFLSNPQNLPNISEPNMVSQLSISQKKT